MAALDLDKIRLSDVQKALGYFPNSVAGVCKYSGVNNGAGTSRSAAPH